jgi:hypothetical protein
MKREGRGYRDGMQRIERERKRERKEYSTLENNFISLKPFLDSHCDCHKK